MEIIVGDKGSGKTHKLIALCKKMNEEAGINNTVIVAKDRKDARRISDMADKMGYRSLPFPVILDDVRQIRPTYYKRLLIDDIDYIMQQVLGSWELAGFTLTYPEDKNDLL